MYVRHGGYLPYDLHMLSHGLYAASRRPGSQLLLVRSCTIRQYNGVVSRASQVQHAERDHLDAIEDVLTIVRQHGGRATPARRLLLQALFGSKEHRSAEELAAEVRTHAPDVHLSTVYRNLEELERLGIIDSTRLGDGPATYHLASAAHGHLVCEKCSSMIEVPNDMFQDLVRTARMSYGFAINPNRFAVTGCCANCQ
jgi:Fur family transcriptional regulator, ferric uptake regulator